MRLRKGVHMNFTELELVLLCALIILLAFHYAQRKLIEAHRQAYYWLMKALNDAADKRVSIYRKADGAISLKPTNSTENSNATSNQA